MLDTDAALVLGHRLPQRVLQAFLGAGGERDVPGRLVRGLVATLGRGSHGPHRPDAPDPVPVASSDG